MYKTIYFTYYPSSHCIFLPIYSIYNLHFFFTEWGFVYPSETRDKF
jgi:hypothetical protein